MLSSKTIVSLILFLVTAPGAFAESFSWELTLDRNEEYSRDLESTALAGEYFFSPVSTDVGPLEQAGFISRSSSIGLFYDKYDHDSNIRSPIDGSERYGISGQYIEKDSGWFVGGGYSESSGSESSDFVTGSFSIDEDEEEYDFRVGKYLFENTTLALSYQRVESEQSILTELDLLYCDTAFCMPVEFNIDETTSIERESYTVDFKHLGIFNDLYYEFSASYTDIEDSIRSKLESSDISPNLSFQSEIKSEHDFSSYEVGMTVYPTKAISIGVNYFAFDNDTTEPETLTLNLKWFVLPSLAVRFSYGKTYFENLEVAVFGIDGGSVSFSPSDQESYSLGLSARF